MATDNINNPDSTDQRNDYVQSTLASPNYDQGVIGALSIPSATRKINAMKALIQIGNDPLQRSPI